MDEFSFLVFEMREISHRFLLGVCYSFGCTLFITAFDDLGNTLVDFVTAIFLEVSLDITEERDVAYSRGYEKEKGTGKDEDGKEGRDRESGCDHIVPREIFLQVVPRRLVILLCQIDGKQSQSIDNLTRAISEEQTLPTFEREENEESKIIRYLRRLLNMVKKKTEMVIGTKGIVIVRHDICEGVRYVTTQYNPLGFPCLISKEEKGEYDTTDK